MPPADQILNGLREIANIWKVVALFWHVYFGVLVVLLAIGSHPSRQLIAVLLGLPILSVSTFAWLSSNPVNGVFFMITGIGILLSAVRLPRENVEIAPLWSLIPGMLFFIFGWLYPHFIDTSSYLPYLYAAPVGIIPCPTLILVTGLVLTLDGLGSRSISTILGVVGLIYGVLGVVYLHIALDWVLILCALIILISVSKKQREPTLSKVMTQI